MSGAVECWGADWTGQTAAPSGRFSAVSAGEDHSCGLRESGEVECWGYTFSSPTQPPDGRFNAVSTGHYHTCGLRESGEVECWGDNRHGETDTPSGRFSAVSAGQFHSCGLRESGEVECWGYTFDGQAQPPTGRYVQISATGSYHACALSEDGTISCWTIYNGAADVPAWLRELSAETAVDRTSGRIVVRRLADGRTEFGWLPDGAAERVLPSSRYLPASGVAVDRWLRSSPIEVDGAAIGRINVRLHTDGRIEFAFTPTGGERILPRSRYLPVNVGVDRWLRSTEIEVGGG